MDKIENFQKNDLNKPNYTPEYKAKLDKIKKSLKKESCLNLGEKKSFWEKILDWDNLEFIAGIGLNLNNLIGNFKKE